MGRISCLGNAPMVPSAGSIIGIPVYVISSIQYTVVVYICISIIAAFKRSLISCSFFYKSNCTISIYPKIIITRICTGTSMAENRIIWSFLSTPF